ncbi:molybdenum cofactor guanylyltransferase [Pollutibacter soli]|uniref:molybdenum cofactor guanylyltransferase n=1 Tax=Pollutibacter soli TaxID=3034157 RepID=UPI003013D652
MIGLVLCGGESKRMGRDKGLILSGKKTWAGVIAEKIQSAGISTYISVNADSSKAYRKFFSDEVLIVDDLSIPVRGPLTGILAAHRHFPDEDILVIACDMQNMTADIIQKLLVACREFPGYNVYLFSRENEPEPLCAVYTSGCLSDVLNKFIEGDRLRFSMKSVLAGYELFIIPIEATEFGHFDNFNSPDDLSRN